MQEWLGADAQVRVKTVRKNNGVVCTGLHDAAREVGAIIYLEPIYQSYQQSGETEEAFGRAMEDIKEQYGKADGGEEIRQLADTIGDFCGGEGEAGIPPGEPGEKPGAAAGGAPCEFPGSGGGV